MEQKKKWTDLLEEGVSVRLAECRSRKSDILPLAQAKWATIKDDPDFTKENALVQVLELLDCNSQFFDLTRDEYDDILNSIV